MGRVQNAARLERRLKAIPKAVKKGVRAAVEAGAGEVVAAQRRLAPKKSGKLARSIRYTMGDQSPPRYAALKSEGQRGDPETTAIITAGNSEVRTAHITEFGSAPHVQGGIFEGAEPAVTHPGTDPQPFFYPGYRLTKKRVKSRVSRAVSKAARDAAGGG